jgi:hypothetical protein
MFTKDAAADTESKELSVQKEPADSRNLKRMQSELRQEQSSARAPEKQSKAKISSTPVSIQTSSFSLSEVPQKSSHGKTVSSLKMIESLSPALPGSEDAHTPERSRHLASDRASAAPKEPPWLRDLTRPLSPFSEVAMVKRNKDLAVR